MNRRNTHSNIKIMIEQGIPPQDFYEKAWASEPLTSVLANTNIPFALPEPDISLIAKYKEDVVGQCSSNRVVKYWDHLKNIDASQQNQSTQIFIQIHKKAIADEEKYLKQINEAKELSFHSAGIAVLPKFRGKQIGLMLRSKQIEICKERKATTLFCETTNSFSAATLENLGFVKLAAYPYKSLALELSYPELSKLNDSFSVWCRKI